MQAIEFYSGLGGLASAAHELGIEVRLSFDIHPLANECHKNNFPGTTTSPTTICNLTARSLRKLFQRASTASSPQFWLLSPPCQPFSRRGQQRDRADPRNASFLHLIELLRIMEEEDLPQFFLMENVAGFEISETHELLLEVLAERNYAVQEFLLSPTQFHIPNQRLRYFCLAKRRPLEFPQLTTGGTILEYIPGYHNGPDDMRNEIPLSQFLEEETEGQTLYHNYCIKENILSKSGRLLDIITPQAISSNCFTKSYGRYVEGSGSVLETCPLVAPSRAFDEQTGEWNQSLGRASCSQIAIFFSS